MPGRWIIDRWLGRLKKGERWDAGILAEQQRVLAVSSLVDSIEAVTSRCSSGISKNQIWPNSSNHWLRNHLKKSSSISPLSCLYAHLILRSSTNLTPQPLWVYDLTRDWRGAALHVLDTFLS